MKWLVEPLPGIRLAAEVSEPAECAAGGTVLHCGCIVGLKTCNCNGGLTVGAT